MEVQSTSNWEVVVEVPRMCRGEFRKRQKLSEFALEK
jgi:hypothetical protein